MVECINKNNGVVSAELGTVVLTPTGNDAAIRTTQASGPSAYASIEAGETHTFEFKVEYRSNYTGMPTADELTQAVEIKIPYTGA